MGYKIVFSNSIAAANTYARTATEALVKIGELRRTGNMLTAIIDDVSRETIGELTLEDRAESENV